MNLVVIGAQWGDEGKGKIVDFISDQADVIVRFSGGANAGHTIVHDDVTYKLHLIPSGVLYPDTRVVLGTGMVIDLDALFEELEELERSGISCAGRVLVSDRAHVVLPRYKQEDIELDRNRLNPIGTTGRGIGIAYAVKSARDGVRIVDLFDDAFLKSLSSEDREYIHGRRDRIRDMVVDLSAYMNGVRDENVLLEGAQGALLDLDLGTYPYVSSGYSCAAGAALGGGIGPKKIDRVLGVCKAYSTRVGNGPFPSEFRGDDTKLGDEIREIGREYGVTTGRARRVGYLDLVALRYICRTNSIDSIALTHLDVYDAVEAPRVCIAYELDDETLDDFPSSRIALENARPVTRALAGWNTPIGKVSSYEALPDAARAYIDFVERFIDTPIDIVSVGYSREQTIVRRNPWTE